MEEIMEGKDFSFPGQEETVLAFWDKIKAFEGQLERSKGQKPFVFYDGPPFATGLPHYGHLLAGTIKDIVTRYASTTGHYVPRRFGWDCHGLPVENEINKKLGLKDRSDVLKMGIKEYNEECRSIVMRYSHEWEKTVRRSGRWIDFKNDYKTLNLEFMETVWWVFAQIAKQGLVYKGMKVMPYSWKLSTTISNNEASENYKVVSDPAVMVSFPVDGDPDKAEIVAWTTTPWTLPSNLALCVHPDYVYVKARDPSSGRVYLVAESRLNQLPGAIPKDKKGKQSQGFEVIERFAGKDLVGKSYEPLFPFFRHLKEAGPSGGGAFRVVGDKYVTDKDGTGVVHQAPFFGEDDLRVCLAHGIITMPGKADCAVDADGRFTAEITDYAGRLVKQYDEIIPAPKGENAATHTPCKDNPDYDIIKAVKAMGRLVSSGSINHKVPFCPRSNTPLLYKAVTSWFIKVEHLREALWQNTAQTYWVPEKVRDGRFRNWLESARDWAVSRSRFWGTPIPIWTSEDGQEIVVLSSVQELTELSGAKITDLHRHNIDHITIPSKQGKGHLKRIDDVFDCWFESGSMPYGQLHYPFENKDFFDHSFPANFVAEGLDQTRGWFYSLMVISTILFKKPAFKNLVCNGMVLAEDGKKMSKSAKNYPDPELILQEYGADALRLYLITSPVVHGESLKFSKSGVFDVIRNVFLPWYNAYRFLVQNVIRHQNENGSFFRPEKVDISRASNVLDRWISAAMRSLTAFVREEMTAYRLYTVVPRLVKFIDNLTNVYVRFNRKRLKGGKGSEDCLFALASLYQVLLTLCKMMAPFTPFLCETLYQNLKKALPDGQPQSVHWCSFPEASSAQAGDEAIEKGVEQMQKVIDLVRLVRDQKKLPLKQPLRKLTIVNPDPKLLESLRGELAEYIFQETNVLEMDTFDNPSNFGTKRAEPVFASLGKRYKEAIPTLKAAIQKLSRSEILEYEETGRLEVEGCLLERGDLKVVNEFRTPAGSKPEDLGAAVDGQLMAILDLRLDERLTEQGLGREVVNRVQKLRKKAGFVVGDLVRVWIQTSPGLSAAIKSQEDAVAAAVGQQLRPLVQRPTDEIVILEERYVFSVNGKQEELLVALSRPLVSCCQPEILEVVGGDTNRALGVVAWLRARDPVKLAALINDNKKEFAVIIDGETVCLRPDRHFLLPS